ncbi:cdc42 effector protein 4 [Triplophysa rosa]|uniref:Cdc42 effector protein 4 n=1 Tax=Triplophysa rosa TaxID=992332 RepID=A0A9W7WD05_TRIRA|nr:cdc42 effector protein 4 [Triplophysa rosa]KAI7796562.1 putative cdc42 effector protein 4 [Triplophysa rosa]
MPILKQLVSTSSQSKRRSRADLTAEMISAPLGDFRHTMHVGRGGDAFGDTTFLSTRTGEPPREPEVQENSPKQSLLSRTFRSSKRSQSVNRDKPDKSKLAPPGGSPSYVKNAISLPYLNDDHVDRSAGFNFPKSVSSSPLKQLPEDNIKPLNGATASLASDLELDEKSFGELTDLRPSVPYTGGMKHAESIMSFHIDLGPSMLGDILSVMEKKGWNDDDLGFEEGKSSEGRSSPPQSPPNEVEEEEPLPPSRPPRLIPGTNPYTPEILTRNHQHLDSCSVSSSGSTVMEDKPHNHLYEDNMVKYSSPRDQDDRDFSYMDDDEEDEEIRV